MTEKDSKNSTLERLAIRIQNKVGTDSSGFRLTKTNADALRWRLMLINLAQTSIDIQS